MEKNELVEAIFKAYGLPESAMVPARVKYIEGWLEKYQLPDELYLYACKVTMEEWHRPNTKDTERIMGIWKGKDVQTMDEAKAVVTELRAKRVAVKNERTEKRQAAIASGTRAFRNFTERPSSNYMEKILARYKNGEQGNYEAKKDDP